MTSASVAGGRPRDPEVDRRITRAAVELFGEAGWSGFNVEAVARLAGVGKASVYLRWTTKVELLTDALTERLAPIADVDTGTLRGDLIELAKQVINLYVGDGGRAAQRIGLEAAAIPGVAEHYEALHQSQIRAARTIVRRGISRGEISPTASVTLLLDTLCGGAMMHAMSTPPQLRAQLAEDVDRYARQLVDFLLISIASSTE
ncbi:MAG TPA: TetR/AcrR family transcriptional regulator [Pseudonocardiaceae bacterium]|jgi:AcrR family transcriptional regulator|nr:TetR/AcrR family transcriptional regulator [Pseudonocardiaceae bacterium]